MALGAPNSISGTDRTGLKRCSWALPWWDAERQRAQAETSDVHMEIQTAQKGGTALRCCAVSSFGGFKP